MTESALDDLILVDHPTDHVARITMNRPERLNAMSIDLAGSRSTTRSTRSAAENDTWVVVLTGAGRAWDQVST